MTPATKFWIERRMNMTKPGRVLEIGSLDINGHIERSKEEQYIGIDIQDGPNVDLICNAHNVLMFEAAGFDKVVCADMLEHDDAPWLTVPEIWRLLKPNGLVIVSASGIGFPRHDYPSDYWRFTTAGLALLFQDFEIMELIDDKPEKAVRMFAKKVIHAPELDFS